LSFQKNILLLKPWVIKLSMCIYTVNSLFEVQ